MTVRTNQVGWNLVVYAGTAEELALVADEYVSGVRVLPKGFRSEWFKRAAAQLRTGRCPALDLGPVRFYRDRPDGTPFQGAFAPEPGEEWVRRQQAVGVAMRR